MKFKLYSKLFLLCLFGLIVMPVQSQTVFLDLKKWDDTQKSIDLNNLRKITFSNANLVLSYVVGSDETVASSSIRKFVFSTYTGVGNVTEDNKSVLIYPNPSTDFIALKNIPEAGELSITLYSISGTQIMKVQLTSADEQIDIRRLSKGIYLVKVNNQVMKFTKL